MERELLAQGFLYLTLKDDETEDEVRDRLFALLTEAGIEYQLFDFEVNEN